MYSRTHSRSFVLIAGLLLAAAPATAGKAGTARAGAHGSLDPTFGAGGTVHTDFARRFDEGWSLAVQPDGRIVVAGETIREVGGADDRNFSVVRYHQDGSLDPSFGTGGKAFTDFGRNFEVAFDMTLQPDGRIVSAGESGTLGDPASFDFALARYRPDGSPDTSFGAGGKVTTDFAGGDDEANAVVLQPDGKIVVAGVSGGDFAMARYDVDGSPDTSFGAGGKLTTDFAGGADSAADLVVLDDGRILVAGMATRPATGGDFALARYRADGSPDRSFGVGGKLTTDFAGSDDRADSLVLQPDGRIVVAGSAGVVTNATGAYALARYTRNGALDTSFGSGGTVTTELTDGQDEVFSLALQRDGRIVAGGVAHWVIAVSGDFALARYNPDGSLDRRFGSGGTVTTDFDGSFDNIFDVAILRDGRILTVGDATFSDATTSRDIGLARYLP